MSASLASSWPVFSDDEIEAVSAVLRSGRVNSLHHGDKCREFERAFAHLCGAPFAISLANGTVSLELALRALEIGPGDEVIVPARSFFASASCIVNVGAKPVFADVELASGNIDPTSVGKLITPRTRALLCVHLAGRPCDMETLTDLCASHDIFLIEDCAQAPGATVNGQTVGSFGAAAAFSFCTDKIISTGGEGGMLILHDAAVFERAWSFKDHGKNRLAMTAPGGSQFRWLHDRFGTNWRLTEMQAAIGICQLAKLPSWLSARRRNAAVLADGLAETTGLIIDTPPDGIEHGYYKFYARLLPELAGDGSLRDSIAAAIASHGVMCGSGSCPEIYLEKAFRGNHVDRLPAAKVLGATSLMFQCDHTMSESTMRAIGVVTSTIVAKMVDQRAAA